MKHIFCTLRTFGALLTVAAAVTACSGDDENLVTTEPQPTDAIYTLSVEAAKTADDDSESRATRALSLDGNTLYATWAKTENVYVKKGDTWATGSLQPQTDGATATLKGTLGDITIAANDMLTLQFPKSGDISYDGQVGTLADIATNFDYATATVEVESVSATGNITPKAATTTFENQQAIVKFTLVDKSTNTAINATELTVSDGTSTYTVTPASATDVLYVALPGFSGQTVTLTATAGSGTYTYEKANVTFANGQYYAITVKMTKEEAVDLSMVDCAGNARANQWTANCYMIHTEGNYKLPLVYGNAIKNGEANTAAYTGVGGATTVATFPNHAGNGIYAPWITKSSSGEGVDQGMGITVTSAELLWQDARGLITDVGISGDYLTLTVGKDAIEQEGNAVVAAKDAEGDIVWSWHIWVTQQTFSTLSTVNTGDHTYQLTPVNLGWVGEATSNTGYNTFYQWGRKDAFIPTIGLGNTNRTVYDINDETVTGMNYSQSNTVTIADNIKTPTTHYYNNNTCGPCNTKYYNLWDAEQTSTSENVSTATKKTIYDPCPAGFCVPTGNLYYYIRNGLSSPDADFAWDNTNKGRYLMTASPSVFFPATGIRYYSYGTVQYVGQRGYYWSATPTSETNGRCMYLMSTSYSWFSNTYRAFSFSVRAVAEE